MPVTSPLKTYIMAGGCKMTHTYSNIVLKVRNFLSLYINIGRLDRLIILHKPNYIFFIYFNSSLISSQLITARIDDRSDIFLYNLLQFTKHGYVVDRPGNRKSNTKD